MVLFIACTIVGVCISFKIIYSKKNIDFFEKIIFSIMGVAASAFIGTVSTGIASKVILHSMQEYEYDKINIVAIDSSKELSGTFILGLGNVNLEQQYVFYYLTADGGKKYGEVSKYSAIIYEEERRDGYMAKIGERTVYSDKVLFWLIPKFLLDGKDSTTYAIHVPKGTVKLEFNIDLK